MPSFHSLKSARNYHTKGEVIFACDCSASGTKRFHVFSSIKQYEDSVQKRQHFYEVVPKYGIRRFYIDIDINDIGLSDDESIFDEEVNKFCNFVDNLQNGNTGVQIYTSHRSGKLSYHLVFRNILHENNEDAKKFFDFVKEEYLIELGRNKVLRFMDPSVYKSNQLFRLLGSSKMGKGNTKILKSGDPGLNNSLVYYFDNN